MLRGADAVPARAKGASMSAFNALDNFDMLTLCSKLNDLSQLSFSEWPLPALTSTLLTGSQTLLTRAKRKSSIHVDLQRLAEFLLDAEMTRHQAIGHDAARINSSSKVT
jgi:hypothetical protein